MRLLLSPLQNATVIDVLEDLNGVPIYFAYTDDDVNPEFTRVTWEGVWETSEDVIEFYFDIMFIKLCYL